MRIQLSLGRGEGGGGDQVVSVPSPPSTGKTPDTHDYLDLLLFG